jgi:hypothetical protein
MNRQVWKPSDLGPQATQVQLAGLTYNKEEHEVVYSEEGKNTVCAVPCQAKEEVTTCGRRRYW